MIIRTLDRAAWARGIAGACLCATLAIVAGACGGESRDAAVTADAAPSRSSGCADAATLRTGTVPLRYEGIDRSYDIVVPDKRSGVPMPVVLGYHGFGGTPQDQAATSGLANRALRDGFVAVFPRGSDSHQSTLAHFNLETIDDPSLADDVGFTEAILDDVEAGLCVDRTRIYAMGMSNGGMFVSTLACALGDRIAAVAPVAGVHLLPDCAARPVPIIVTHGTSDLLVPFDVAGTVSLADLLSGSATSSAQLRMFEKVFETPVTSWVESWARHNGCSLEAPEVTTVGNEVERTAYADCDDGGDVVLQAVDSGGHEWPVVPRLDTTARALAFFREHSLPADALAP